MNVNPECSNAHTLDDYEVAENFIHSENQINFGLKSRQTLYVDTLNGVADLLIETIVFSL